MSSRRIILLALSFVSFTVIFNSLILTPILVEIANEFRVSVPVAGQLVTAYALPGAVIGLIIGPFADTYGRRPIVLLSLVVSLLASVATAFAWSYVSLAGFRMLSGLAAGSLFPTALAVVGDIFPYEERGRAMAWMITANTLAAIIGIPAASILAEFAGWRSTFLFLAVILALVIWVVFRELPARQASGKLSRETFFRTFQPILASISARAALVSNFIGALLWFGYVTYLGAFFISSFGLSTGSLAPILAMLGIGVLIGGNIGGRLGDRVGHKRVIVGSLMVGMPFMVLQLNWVAGVFFAAALNLMTAGPNGARFASTSTLMSELVPQARGTMLALNSSVQTLGIMMGSILGGVAIAVSGYGLLGWLIGGLSLLSAAVMYRWVEEGGPVGN